MKDVKEHLFDEALDLVGQGASYRHAQATWSVHRSTLHARKHGQQPRTEAFKGMQRLSPEQEAFLSDWCLNEESAGRAPKRPRIVGFAEAILREGGDLDHLGPH